MNKFFSRSFPFDEKHMETPMGLSLVDVFYERLLQKSPNFDDASVVPPGKNGSSKRLGLRGSTIAKLHQDRQTREQHALNSQARINAAAGITPERAAQIDPHMETLAAERERALQEAHDQFGHDRNLLSRAVNMVHDQYNRKVHALIASLRRPELPTEREEPMELSLTDVFYGKKIRKGKGTYLGEIPDDSEEQKARMTRLSNRVPFGIADETTPEEHDAFIERMKKFGKRDPVAAEKKTPPSVSKSVPFPMQLKYWPTRPQ